MPSVSLKYWHIQQTGDENEDVFNNLSKRATLRTSKNQITPLTVCEIIFWSSNWSQDATLIVNRMLIVHSEFVWLHHF